MAIAGGVCALASAFLFSNLLLSNGRRRTILLIAVFLTAAVILSGGAIFNAYPR